jgi:hypothetical protein
LHAAGTVGLRGYMADVRALERVILWELGYEEMIRQLGRFLGFFDLVYQDNKWSRDTREAFRYSILKKRQARPI